MKHHVTFTIQGRKITLEVDGFNSQQAAEKFIAEKFTKDGHVVVIDSEENRPHVYRPDTIFYQPETLNLFPVDIPVNRRTFGREFLSEAATVPGRRSI